MLQLEEYNIEQCCLIERINMVKSKAFLPGLQILQSLLTYQLPSMRAIVVLENCWQMLTIRGRRMLTSADSGKPKRGSAPPQ